jgi:hypothetical protein
LQVLGDKAMLEDYDFGEISGGRFIVIVQRPALRSWMPAGVIFLGPNPTGVEGESIRGWKSDGQCPHFATPEGTIFIVC